jgi:hypothetical protein
VSSGAIWKEQKMSEKTKCGKQGKKKIGEGVPLEEARWEWRGRGREREGIGKEGRRGRYRI